MREGQVPGNAEYDLLNAADKQTNWLTKRKDKAVEANRAPVALNRHRHLLPYDETRVKLVTKTTHGNYINATWISKAGSNKVHTNNLISNHNSVPITSINVTVHRCPKPPPEHGVPLRAYDSREQSQHCYCPNKVEGNGRERG